MIQIRLGSSLHLDEGDSFVFARTHHQDFSRQVRFHRGIVTKISCDANGDASMSSKASVIFDVKLVLEKGWRCDNEL